MTDTKEVTPVKRGRGRPKKVDPSSQRQNRVPVGGFRDKLTVQNRDPNFYYRWVLDTDATGARILEHQHAGYVFVHANEGVEIGETYVFSTPDGDILRKPANKQGDYLYLMKLPMEFHEQDNEAKRQVVNKTEESLYPGEDTDERYGTLKINR